MIPAKQWHMQGWRRVFIALGLMGVSEFLPDAAKERAARNAATELRSS